jgi:hypothetical protein
VQECGEIKNSSRFESVHLAGNNAIVLIGDGEITMRKIEGSLTDELAAYLHETPVDAADPLPVSTYRKLVENVAKLSFLNKDYLFFFRGQSRDYRNKAGASTFYPSIYRGDYVGHWEIQYRFEILEETSEQLKRLFSSEKIVGYPELNRKKYIQWSILQHYEVCNTPLLDLTHSLRVACSFAQLFAEGSEGYVYVFGFPYITNRISIHSEHDLVNVRLLSICPPDALRPYFQEGYLAGTADITSEYDNKTELDFRNRLIAKFEIPKAKRFWGSGFSSIPRSVLFPKGDRVGKICQEIEVKQEQELRSEELGEFIKEWSRFEDRLVKFAETQSDQVSSISEAMDFVRESEKMNPQIFMEIDEIRRFRNRVIYEWKDVKTEDVLEAIDRIRKIREGLVLE